MKVTDIKTGFKILEERIFKPFIGKGLLGGGFLGDERIKQFWHGLELSEKDSLEFQSDTAILVIPIQDFFEMAGINEQIPTESQGVKMCLKLCEGHFKALTFTSIVLPAFSESEALIFTDLKEEDKSFIDFPLTPSV